MVKTSDILQLVEQHVIDRQDPRFRAIDAASFASKNLYNAGLYQLRQAFFNKQPVPSYSRIAHSLKETAEYQALPAKVSQWVLRQVCRDWSNFWKAQRAYEKSPAKFAGRPKMPHYKAKQRGRNLLVYTAQALSGVALKDGWVIPSQLAIKVKTMQREVDQVRISPKATCYVVEVVYRTKCASPKESDLNPLWAASLDLGVNVLAAETSNKPGFIPLLINGGPLKSINAYYNKRRADLQSQLPPNQFSSRRLEQLTEKRNRKVKHYLHWASRYIIDRMLRERIATLAIGHNSGWKHEVEMGRINNQNFVSIPHSTFIHMLTYKAQLAGIKVIVKEEWYTSKCSFLDLEPIGKHKTYLGRRVRRGEFVASDGRHIHADVNGSYNILRHVLPAAFSRGIKGVVVHPVRVQPVRKLDHWQCA